jgi:hypothetical protein
MDSEPLKSLPGPGQVGWHASAADEAISVGKAWLLSPAFRTLITRLSGPCVTSLEGDLADLLAWSTRTLDTRGGGERQDASPAGYNSGQISALLEAAGPLGLLSTPPPFLPGYDLTIILGGTVTGNELRVSLARTIAASGIRLGTLVALTANRPLRPAEHPPAGHLTEAGHLTAALTTAFPAASPTHQTGGERAFGSDIQVVIADSSRPGYRANTGDAIAELTRRIPPPARRTVLAVTSAIYVPYQFFVIAPALLRAGTQYAEIIGTPTAADGQGSVLAQRLGQEIHATIATIAGHISQ